MRLPGSPEASAVISRLTPDPGALSIGHSAKGSSPRRCLSRCLERSDIGTGLLLNLAPRNVVDSPLPCVVPWATASAVTASVCSLSLFELKRPIIGQALMKNFSVIVPFGVFPVSNSRVGKFGHSYSTSHLFLQVKMGQVRSRSVGLRRQANHNR